MNCFYCGKPIAANEEIVRGVTVAVHRHCVRARVESFDPDAFVEHRRPGPKHRCRRGHALDEANLRITPSGNRRCRTCDRLNNKRWTAIRRARLKAAG